MSLYLNVELCDICGAVVVVNLNEGNDKMDAESRRLHIEWHKSLMRLLPELRQKP